jgi:hypothetical protein
MRQAACLLARAAAALRRLRRPVVGGALLGAAAGSLAMTCSAHSSTPPPRVVELYTSEGCSSCPPADAWLSTLKGRGDVIALGFHVHYWDRLGWPDRFASEAYTRRQYEAAARHGSRGVYTPQVLVDGSDWRGWPRLPPAAAPRAEPPEVTLLREPDGRVHARVAPAAASPQRLAAYWAVVENGHISRVRAGENAGETLRHDHVVRLHRELPPFAARDGLSSHLDVPPGAAEHRRRIVFVVTSLADGRPVQAVALDC